MISDALSLVAGWVEKKLFGRRLSERRISKPVTMQAWPHWKFKVGSWTLKVRSAVVKTIAGHVFDVRLYSSTFRLFDFLF